MEEFLYGHMVEYLTLKKICHVSSGKVGYQSDFLYIAEAIGDYLKHPSPIEAWSQGEKIFHKRLGLRS